MGAQRRDDKEENITTTNTLNLHVQSVHPQVETKNTQEAAGFDLRYTSSALTAHPSVGFIYLCVHSVFDH